VILVGTSGWQYDHWRGVLYPEGLPKRLWLQRYAEVFPTVEVNNSFYRLPASETFVKWREQTPPGFAFAIKASRYVTHIRRLRDAGDSVELFWSRVQELGRKRGPVLFQLPPRFKADTGLLQTFVDVLPKGPNGMRAAFEFRDPSWQTDEVHAILDRAGAALVLADRPGARVPQVVTGGWSYIRFHLGQPESPGYTREKLGRWADRIAALPADRTYVYFNNDGEGAAVRDARTLTELLEAAGARVSGPSPAALEAAVP
jgi:uncharacterized protein YecE (DUF72 family)